MSGQERVRRVVGCMTGTSIDGLDVSLVEIEGEGLAMRAKVVRSLSRELGELSGRLRELAEQKPLTAGAISALARDFAMLHAGAIRELLAGERADLVCVHGQTVFHAPPLSWQLMQPAPIAAEIGCPVVYDLRQADLAAGGQGAPITPIADWVFYREVGGTIAVVNLGGFCNLTVIPEGTRPETVRALDVCACNQLLDAIARKLMQSPYDKNGERAAQGEVHNDALEDLDGILTAQAASRRSLGTGDELADWISRFRLQVSADDLAATACEAIGGVIAKQVQDCQRVLLAGGGVRNKALVAAITSCCSAKVSTTESFGVAPEYREAASFAVLGALCHDRVPITIPAVTGVKKAPVSGAWVYP